MDYLPVVRRGVEEGDLRGLLHGLSSSCSTRGAPNQY